MNSDIALKKLKEGNEKYYKNNMTISFPFSNKDREELVKKGQHPFACVISCSDSRVIPEDIFSLGFGEIFTIRSAGNVIDDYELGSVEYAAVHLNTPLIVVMGHTYCGAVSSAIEGHAEGHIQHIIDKIKESFNDTSDERACEWNNVYQSCKILLDSDYITSLLNEGKLKICAAMYDTKTGVVTFKPMFL